ncbi:FadR/GntR family transcriptional regulator [Conexibacter woesei]|uniref:Regulatory protein GntR HTH n=1 Tax=Conexibacter woesei (strain DSM 14684 / CCUG 47730 / CIP 108061 / JCM 11494 / NBRC 100937 / ID131577) TaxID=469383 RepID=D3F3L7_CONWI|nr:GntR family transcriptional regulator [Conexibacter woesei]ADB52382.1 regulatory protein GntR HTH [Conexibacter woesei DSM 14684]
MPTKTDSHSALDEDRGERAQTLFSSARRVRSFDDVTEQIRDAILSGEVAQGERLPSERELCQTFGVSRATLREALRSLEALGLLAIRPGKTGGAFAVRPSESTLGDALSALVHMRGASAQDLAEFRVDFDGWNAWWAAHRAGPDDVAVMKGLVRDAREAVKSIDQDLSTIADIDSRWHQAVARATQNRLRVGISLGLHEPIGRLVDELQPADRRYARSIPTALAKVTKAIEARDAEAARAAMWAHIDEWNLLNPQVEPSPDRTTTTRKRAGR